MQANLGTQGLIKASFNLRKLGEARVLNFLSLVHVHFISRAVNKGQEGAGRAGCAASTCMCFTPDYFYAKTKHNLM